jgi:uncharacterized protein
MRVILDTNIFISAFIFGGQVQVIFDKLLDKEFEIVTCNELNNEIMDKLVNKFKISEVNFELVLRVLNLAQEYKLKNIGKYTRDVKDDFLIELGLVSSVDFIVSGDKDVLILVEIGNTKIISPNSFLKILTK